MTNETNIPETEAEVTTGKNDKRKSDLLRAVGKLGEEASLGRDSLPKLAHAVVKAAADGVIDGSDAEGLYTKYATAESKKAIHEHSAGGKKANISKLKQLIEMGCMTTIDAVEVMQAAFQARENMIADSEKVKAAYPFYVEVARAQLKTDKPLDQNTLEDMAKKDEPNAKTLEGELKKVAKVLEGLISGENRDKIKDNSEQVEAAFHLIQERLDALTLVKRQEQLRQKARELGIELAA